MSELFTMDDCPICYEPVNVSTGYCTLACKHSYHIACLTKWCNQETTCPMCRRELSETEAVARPRSYLKDLDAGDHIVFAEQNAGAGILHRFMMRLGIPWNDLGLAENPPPPVGPPPNANRILRIGGGVEVSEGDVVLVMVQANATRGAAVRALRRHDGDIVNSIMMLADEHDTERARPRAPRDPLVDPADDQATAWFLRRMFREDTPRSVYPFNSCMDLQMRMNLVNHNLYDSWKHAEFNDVPARHDGYETA